MHKNSIRFVRRLVREEPSLVIINQHVVTLLNLLRHISSVGLVQDRRKVTFGTSYHHQQQECCIYGITFFHSRFTLSYSISLSKAEVIYALISWRSIPKSL